MATPLHSDHDLIEACLNGEQKAYAILVDRYKNNVATVILNMTADRDLTAELAQQTFIRLYRFLHKYRSEASLKTFVIRIAINLTLNELKRKGKRNYETLDGLGEQLSVTSGYNEEREIVNKALQRLKPEQRSVITLRHIEGYSTKECAEMLEIPEGTVLSRLSRAIDSFRTELKKLGYEHN
ncbi:MAG: sigma-70 family RNA polymerase sigma factor [Flavobacteriales bacterium]|nr:sigma-70 family RNA polymerase sigma factor [Flavobacteriales bacterium]